VLQQVRAGRGEQVVQLLRVLARLPLDAQQVAAQRRAIALVFAELELIVGEDQQLGD